MKTWNTLLLHLLPPRPLFHQKLFLNSWGCNDALNECLIHLYPSVSTGTKILILIVLIRAFVMCMYFGETKSFLSLNCIFERNVLVAWNSKGLIIKSLKEGIIIRANEIWRERKIRDARKILSICWLLHQYIHFKLAPNETVNFFNCVISQIVPRDGMQRFTSFRKNEQFWQSVIPARFPAELRPTWALLEGNGYLCE